MAEKVKKVTFDVFGKEYELAGVGPDTVGTEEIKNDSVEAEDLHPNVREDMATASTATCEDIINELT